MKTNTLVMAMPLLLSTTLWAQPRGFNYDESKVPTYSLPDPLQLDNGRPVRDAATWREQRRSEILRSFETHVYGKVPEAKVQADFNEVERGMALDGKAMRKQVVMTLRGTGGRTCKVDLLIFLPSNADKPVPAFVGLNFRGNHTVHSDPTIRLPNGWVPNRDGITDHKPSAKSRGVATSRWPIAAIIDRGYGLITAYYGDLDPDFDDGFANGIHPLFGNTKESKPTGDAWGSIGAWAWGLSRMLDYCQQDSAINAKQVAVLGHSRLGKTALWAGARDERFAIVISNNSGCGGAALSKRRFGETVKRINTSFPHWFCDNFNRYNDKEETLPLDQHMLVALMAPRPVYIASATADQWADPKGEFLAAVGADPVYKLFGLEGLPNTTMPPPDKPVHGTIGYHLRTGKHDVTLTDWQHYMDFADKHFGR